MWLVPCGSLTAKKNHAGTAHRMQRSCSLAPAAGCLEGERAGRVEGNYLPYRTCCARCRVAEQGLATLDPGRAAVATGRHRRDAVVEAGACQAVEKSKNRAGATTVFAARDGVRNLGHRYQPAAVDTRQQHRRCAVDRRADTQERQLRRRDPVAVACARRVLAPAEPGRPDDGHLVLADAADGLLRRRIAGVAAPGPAPGTGGRCHRHRQTPRSALRRPALCGATRHAGGAPSTGDGKCTCC